MSAAPVTMDEMILWVVSFNAKDYPAKYAARRWVRGAATDTVVSAASLNAVRALLPAGVVHVEASQQDNPAIIESWLEPSNVKGN